MIMTDDFTGKRVLVTGAAKGIGLATAKLLAERGAEVIAFDRSVVDLGDVEATRIAVREVLPIDMLVNCAGIVELESFLRPAPRPSTAPWRLIRGRRWWWPRR